MLEIKAVIFDMDGLMVDTEKYGIPFCMEANSHFGYEMTREMVYPLIGTNTQSAKAYYYSIFGNDYPYDAVREYNASLRKEFYKTHPLEVKYGLYELLDFLKEKGIKMVVASSTRTPEVLHNLQTIHVDHYFDYIIGGDQIVNGKPAPDIFLKAIELLKIEPHEAVVLEDSKNGILASHAASIPVICIPDLIYHDKEINDLTYAVLDDLTQVMEHIA